jgi:hypothetical protein
MDLHLENLMDGDMPKLKTYAWMKMTLHILGRLPHATTTGTTLPPGPEHTINAPGCRPAKELPQPTRKFRRGSTRRRLDGARHLDWGQMKIEIEKEGLKQIQTDKKHGRPAGSPWSLVARDGRILFEPSSSMTCSNHAHTPSTTSTGIPTPGRHVWWPRRTRNSPGSWPPRIHRRTATELL